MRIGLINIGDEILAGKILNTNARDLALWVSELGHELAFMLTVPDGIDTLEEPLRRAVGESPEDRCDMLILSGGLGPTHDDYTRQALARHLDVPLERNEDAVACLARFLRIEADRIPPGQATQVMVPRGVTALHNPAGTACGLGFTEGGCAIFAFPGVPREFKALFDIHCRPLLDRREAVLLRRRAVTYGLSESRQRDHLRDYVVPPPFRFSSLPNATGVTIALETFAPATEEARLRTTLDAAWEDLLGRLPADCIVSRDGTPLTETVARLLHDAQASVSTAESCTAGLVGHLLTSVPGTSPVFPRGFITYANEAKQEMLGVPAETLKTYGPVSEETARAMAKGCLAAANTDYAISVTGIAGPESDETDKPVGLVYVGIASRRSGGVAVTRFMFREDREGNRRLGAYNALNQLRLTILADMSDMANMADMVKRAGK